MILDGQTVAYILYLCSDKSAFDTIVKEAVQLIKGSEPTKEDKKLGFDKDLFAADTKVEDVDFD